MKRRNFELTIMIILALLIVGTGIRLFVTPINELPNISLSNIRYEDSNMYTQASSGKVKNISNLEVSWVSGSVEIISYDGNEVRFEETSNLAIPDKDQMCYWQDGDTLKIQFTSPGIHKSLISQKNLFIYIPAYIKLNDLDIDVVSADVTISGISAKDAEFETVSGEYTITDFDAIEISYDSTSGNFNSENIGFVSFDGDSVSGEINLALSPVYQTKNIEVDTVSGDIQLALPKNYGFTLNFDSVSGDLSCNAACSKISKHQIISGDGSLKIEADTVSGDLFIL